MSAVRDDETFDRAGRIIAESRVAALAEMIVCRSVAAVRASRTLAAARRRVQELQGVPADERRRCGMLLLAAALAGHVLLAAMLPPPARPTVTLTALALLAAALAGGAAALRNR
jgi:hypothetical protein